MERWKYLGECSSLLAAMIWALSMSLYTRYGQGVSSRHLNLFKTSLALLCLGSLALLSLWHWPSHPRSYFVLASSGLIGLALGDSLLFFSLKSIGVQRTAVIQCLAPPFAAVLAWILWDEYLVLREWLGLLITMTFLALLLKARSTQNSLPLAGKGLLAALAAAFCQALAMTSLRFSLQGVDVWAGTFLRIAAAFLGLLTFAAFRGDLLEFKHIFQSKKRALMLAAAAFLGTFIGLLLMSVGAKYAKAGVATALSSTTPIWILPVAHFLLGERISLKLLLLTAGVVTGLAVMIVG